MMSNQVSSFDTIVKNGRLVFPGQGVFKGNIAIKDGLIAAVTGPETVLEGDSVIDAQGNHVFPGVIDTHTHTGIGAGLTDFETESRAFALGGVTAFMMFLREPTPYGPIFETAREQGESLSYLDFGFHAVLLIEEHLEELDSYVTDLGISSFKFYMSYRGDDAAMRTFDLKSVRFEGVDDGFMYDAFRRIARHEGAMAIVHCENIEIIQRLRNEYKADPNAGLAEWNASRPTMVEVEAIRRAALIAEETGASMQVLHLTSGEGLSEVEKARLAHRNIYVEVCHPYLAQHFHEGLDRKWKMRPSLRTELDVEQLWQGLQNGSVDTIGSDHVPRPLAAKEGDIWAPTSGSGGTPYMLPLLITEGYHKRDLPLERIAQLVSERPAQLYGMYPQKGSLILGTDADLTIVDVDADFTLRPEDLGGQCDFSLYDDRQLKGAPFVTMVRGQVIAREGEIVAERGWGKYV